MTAPREPAGLASMLASFLREVWTQGDVSNLDRYLAPAYTVRSDPGDPWEGQTLDRDAFCTRLRYSRDAFPDLRFDILESMEGTDRVAVRWRMSGTHRDDLPGLTIYDVEDGRLCGHAQAFDRLGFLAQTGGLQRITGPEA